MGSSSTVRWALRLSFQQKGTLECFVPVKSTIADFPPYLRIMTSGVLPPTMLSPLLKKLPDRPQRQKAEEKKLQHFAIKTWPDFQPRLLRLSAYSISALLAPNVPAVGDDGPTFSPMKPSPYIYIYIYKYQWWFLVICYGFAKLYQSSRWNTVRSAVAQKRESGRVSHVSWYGTGEA